MCGTTPFASEPDEYWIHEDPEKPPHYRERFDYDPFQRITLQYYARTPRNYHIIQDGVLSMFHILSNTNQALSGCEDWFIPHLAVYHYRQWAYKLGLHSLDVVHILLLLSRVQRAYREKENEFFVVRYYHVMAATYISQSILYDQPLSKYAWHEGLAGWMVQDDQYPDRVDYLYGAKESYKRLIHHVFSLLEIIDYDIYYTAEEFNKYSDFMNYNSLVDKLKN